jgi:hypothetical protein
MDTPVLTPLGLLFLLYTSDQQKNINFVWDNPMNIPTKFGSNWPKFTDNDDDGHQVVAIPYVTLSVM